MSGESQNPLAAAVRSLREQDEFLQSLYETQRESVRRAAVLVARCRNRGCLLLEAWKIQGHVAAYKPGFKQSRTLNLERSNESGRQRNTYDGDRHWKPHAFLLDAARDWPEHRVTLQCDHVELMIATSALLQMAEQSAAGHPTRLRMPLDSAESL